MPGNRTEDTHMSIFCQLEPYIIHSFFGIRVQSQQDRAIVSLDLYASAMCRTWKIGSPHLINIVNDVLLNNILLMSGHSFVRHGWKIAVMRLAIGTENPE